MRRGRWRRPMTLWAVVGLLGVLPMAARANGPGPSTSKTFAQMVEGLRRLDGLLPVYLDAKGARVLLVLSPGADGDCGEYLYQVAIRAGLGSTPVGIDRAKPGPTNLLAFRRVGGKVMAELENTSFTADGGSPDEKGAVRESFPPSVVWAGEVLAERPDGAILVDISGFLARDAFGVMDALKDAGQGAFRLAADRSWPDVAEVQAFKDNLEFETHETFVSDAPGEQVKAIAPEPHAFTLIAHQSLVRPPPPGYTPRLADPRTGSFDTMVTNYAAPLGSPLVQRLANRFRLEKTDPGAARSPVKKPIVFYVDRAAPEPVRQALIDGARWWAQAFDAAGFVDAFRVEVLPEGASPLDVDYNVISWVHRQTRGWSYGGAAISDPRTGEIIKGFVQLGSQRARQDRIIFEGLIGADKTGTGAPDDPVVVSLARLRQLAVHETGHALGLAHNMAGSTYGDRASVMDYPPPRVGIVDGRLDFADAYKVGLGDWDRFAIHWLYSQAPAGAAGRTVLEGIVRDGYAHGLRYVRDEDSRPLGSAHPAGALWDDGSDSVEALNHVMAVRRIALDGFGPRNIPQGAPLSDLRRVIVPIYLFHRYEVEAVAKSVGGVDFTYGVRGDALAGAHVVPGEVQRRAVAALLGTLDPSVLDLPSPLIDQLSAGRDGTPDPQYETEQFGAARTPVFDITAAAEAAADITLSSLLEPSRLQRVADQGARDPASLRLAELMMQTTDNIFGGAPGNGREGQIRRTVRVRLVIRLASLARDTAASPAVAAAAEAALERIGRQAAAVASGDPADVALARRFARMILGPSRDELAALVAIDRKRGVTPPPGMPIGGGEDGWFSESVGVTF